jgi:pimeloyl-ACP methyl ester carboxylesterase
MGPSCASAIERLQGTPAMTGTQLIGLVALCLAGCVVTSPPDVSAALHEQSAVASRGFFYIGGKYTVDPGKQIMAGQIFVEVIAPKKVRRQYPLVLIHGAAQTATNWMGTPDGRQGWVDYFVEKGYIVYLVDQPMRGRSAWHPSDGPTRMVAASEIERQFTAAAELGDWPQAGKHTQWPGNGPLKGRRGDPIFDAFYATQVESLASEPTPNSTRKPPARRYWIESDLRYF